VFVFVGEQELEGLIGWEDYGLIGGAGKLFNIGWNGYVCYGEASK
jgi:hypothetical protein